MEETKITLEEAIQALTTGFFLLLFTSFIAWRRGFYKHLEEQKEKKLPSNILISAFLIFLLFSIAIGPAFSAFLVYFFTGELDIANHLTLVLVNSLSILVVFLALFSFYTLLNPEDKTLIVGKYFGPLNGFKKTISDILFGVMTWFISFPFIVVVGKLVYLFLYFFGLEVIPNQDAVNQVQSSLESPLIFSFIALDTILFVPIIEEFVFRGCLQTWLKTRIGIIKAIILTSVIFASFHFTFNQGLGNIELLVSLFVLSCFLGFIYERQKSLLASISLHAFFNGVTVTMISFS